MKRIGLLIAFLGALFIVLPTLTAQDGEKKDADKAEKKDEAKKDEPKKDKDEPKKDKDEPKKDKDEPKKDDEKKKKDEPKKEKLNYGQKFVTKVISANVEAREFTVETREIDQKKQYDVQVWQTQRNTQLAQQLAQANQALAQGMASKDFKARIAAQQNYAKAMANYERDVYNFKVELAKKDVTTVKPFDVRANDEAKVRSMNPPVEFDDQGFQKKWTKKELEERRDKTGLPGFAVEWDHVKAGQTVEIYLVKAPAPPKDQPKKKKGPDDDPVPPEAKGRPEFIMIVILAEPAVPK
jgi:hypothetical protein